MGNRSGVIMIENEHVAMIERCKAGRTYYVFPGGQQERGETLEQAAMREAKEELGVDVVVGELIATVAYNGMQYYYAANIVSGQFGTSNGPEFTSATEETGTYRAVWLPIVNLQKYDVIPKEVAFKILEGL